MSKIPISTICKVCLAPLIDSISIHIQSKCERCGNHTTYKSHSTQYSDEIVKTNNYEIFFYRNYNYFEGTDIYSGNGARLLLSIDGIDLLNESTAQDMENKIKILLTFS